MTLHISFTPSLTLTDSGIQASGYVDVPWGGDQSDFIDQALGESGWLQDFVRNVICYGTVNDENPRAGVMPDWEVAWHAGSGEGFPRLVGAESGDWRPGGHYGGRWMPRSFYDPDPRPTEPSYLRLEAVSARIKHIEQTPLIVASAHWANHSSVDTEHSVSLAHKETQTLSVSTSETHEVAKGASVTVEGKLPVGGDASDTESVSVTDSVEHSTASEHGTELESAGELKATLKPGDMVVAAITIYKGTVIAEVDVNASLGGCLAIAMDSFKQAPNGYFHSFAAGPHRRSSVNVGDFDWKYIADNAPVSLSAKAVTIEVRADFYARLDADTWDVDSFSEDDINQAIWGDPNPGTEVIYDDDGG